MKIFYSAIDQTVPGTKGGSTHVQAVAEGLAARGHEVHVAVRPGASRSTAGAWEDTDPHDDAEARRGRAADQSDVMAAPSTANRSPRSVGTAAPAGASGSLQWHAIGAPFDRPQLRLFRAGAIRRLAETIRPDVVMERYHNFGGEGLLAARRIGARAVLEVNAPVIDYPGSPKARLDRLLLVQPLRRWRDWQCRVATRIVAPTRDILPPWVPAERVHETEWGADTERFRPDASGALPFIRDGRIVVVFVGAFRAWHGVRHLVQAMRRLHERGDRRFRAVLIGDGPERAPAEAEAGGLDAITFTGALPHDRLAPCLAAADIGAAPFDIGAHAPLSLTFYWSPLKMFEYMAAGLPVVAPDIPRLREILGDGAAGLLYDPRGSAPVGSGRGGADGSGSGGSSSGGSSPASAGSPPPGSGDHADALADALVALADPTRRAALGAAARERAVREYSWASHCAKLEVALREG